MSNRLFDLQTRAAFGLLTSSEETELESLAAVGDFPGHATASQKDYIEVLIDKLGADLADYDVDDADTLSLDDATELIDRLKDDVTDDDAWDN